MSLSIREDSVKFRQPLESEPVQDRFIKQSIHLENTAASGGIAFKITGPCEYYLSPAEGVIGAGETATITVIKTPFARESADAKLAVRSIRIAAGVCALAGDARAAKVARLWKIADDATKAGLVAVARAVLPVALLPHKESRDAGERETALFGAPFANQLLDSLKLKLGIMDRVLQAIEVIDFVKFPPGIDIDRLRALHAENTQGLKSLIAEINGAFEGGVSVAGTLALPSDIGDRCLAISLHTAVLQAEVFDASRGIQERIAAHKLLQGFTRLLSEMDKTAACVELLAVAKPLGVDTDRLRAQCAQSAKGIKSFITEINDAVEGGVNVTFWSDIAQRFDATVGEVSDLVDDVASGVAAIETIGKTARD